MQARRGPSRGLIERLQPIDQAGARRPGWCTSGLSAGYVPSKPRMERSSPAASGPTRVEDSPGHLLAIALIPTSYTALSRQGQALHDVECPVGGPRHTRKQKAERGSKNVRRCEICLQRNSPAKSHNGISLFHGLSRAAFDELGLFG